MIEVRNLVKKYGDHTAVDNLSFTVEKGQIYGFLGPNGAGKTTTMNILTGCLAATSGEVLINGHNIYSDAQKAKSAIGYLPEQPPLYLDMTPYEYLCHVGRLKEISKKELREKVNEVMEIVKITDVKDRLNKNLSKGYKQRVGLAQAILGNPGIIILDEPTVGLDPVQIVEIRDVIKSLAPEHTVIFSSHILSEVSAICNYILIISNGVLVAEDTTENLESRFTASTEISLTVKGDRDTICGVLDGLDGVEGYEVSDAADDGTVGIIISCKDGTDISEALSYAMLQQKCLILKLETRKASLEDVFMELVAQDADINAVQAETELGDTDGEQSGESFEVDADALLDGNVRSVWDEHMPENIARENEADNDNDAVEANEEGEEE